MPAMPAAGKYPTELRLRVIAWRSARSGANSRLAGHSCGSMTKYQASRSGMTSTPDLGEASVCSDMSHAAKSSAIRGAAVSHGATKNVFASEGAC